MLVDILTGQLLHHHGTLNLLVQLIELEQISFVLCLDLLELGTLPSVLVINQVLQNEDLVLCDLIERDLSEILDDLTNVF